MIGVSFHLFGSDVLETRSLTKECSVACSRAIFQSAEQGSESAEKGLTAIKIKLRRAEAVNQDRYVDSTALHLDSSLQSTHKYSRPLAPAGATTFHPASQNEKAPDDPCCCSRNFSSANQSQRRQKKSSEPISGRRECASGGE